MSWVYDPAHSSVGFSVRHLGLSTVRGRFSGVTVDAELDPENPAGARARVDIDVNSIDTGNEQRDGHLRAGDFFDTATHPRITFELTSVVPKGDGEYRVLGDLTIRGVTHPVELDAEFHGVANDPQGNTKAGLSLSGSINRNDYGIGFNMALEAGRLVLGERVKLDVDAQLLRTAEVTEAAA